MMLVSDFRPDVGVEYQAEGSGLSNRILDHAPAYAGNAGGLIDEHGAPAVPLDRRFVRRRTVALSQPTRRRLAAVLFGLVGHFLPLTAWRYSFLGNGTIFI
jgi:hypothetical protein